MVWDERIERNLRAQQEYFDGKQEGLKEGVIEGKNFFRRNRKNN